MSFDSTGFALLALVTLVAVHAIASERLRHWWLLVASYIFYGAWDYRFLALIGGVSLVAYASGLAVAKRRCTPEGRVILALAVSAMLAPLLVFKYFDFFSASFRDLFAAVGWHADILTLSLILPVGISFFTFQAISYVIDVSRGNLEPEHSMVRLLLYVAFFPQLVAGPIVRATDFLPQLQRPWTAPPAEVVATNLLRFLWGYFKKVYIADRLALAIVDPVFAQPAGSAPETVLLAVFGFSLLIYADFSAYSDMAIGLARMLGYRLEENFLSPYCATSIRDFWRRWHVSLSSCIRDYLYIPLGGSRCATRVRNYANLIASMTLCGLWHGAAWSFVVWGLVHGIALALQRAFPMTFIPPLLRTLVGWSLTTLFVLAGWLLFRASSLDHAREVVTAMVSGTGTGQASLALQIFVGLCAAVVYSEQAVLRYLRDDHRRPRLGGAYVPAVSLIAGTTLGLFVLLITDPELGSRNFIYFQF